MVGAVERALPGADHLLSRRDGEHAYFDLWRANQEALLRAGVLAEHIEASRLCTVDHADRFFSHRATGGQTGRFAGIIGLRPDSGADDLRTRGEN